ncbi:MAG: M16 family metallopeptidase, partial [Nannocystaceae bacterium]
TRELGTTDYGHEGPRLEHIRQLYDVLGKTTDPAVREALLKQIDAVSQSAGKVAIPNEFDRLLQEIGSTGVNAFTTPDLTVYHNAFPASRLPQWLALYAHRFEKPVFRLFQSELEAVYEEKNRSMDGFDPLVDVFLGSFFRHHPYRLQGSVLGRVEHLKNPSLSEMQRFFDTYYVANNMGLMLAGDIEASEVLPLVEAAFGGWRSGEVPEFPVYSEPEFDGRQQVTVRMTPVRVAGMGFRTVPEGHPDYAALLVCNRLLSNPQEAGLLDNLAREGGVLLTQAVPVPLHDHGIQLVAYAPRILTQSFRGAERKVRAQFEKLKQGKFDDDTLAGVRRSLVNEYRQRFESNQGRVLAMADVYGRGATWPSFVAFLAELEKVDRARVSQVAARYFGDNYLMIHSRAGRSRPTKLDKPGFRPVQPSKANTSKYGESIRNIPS